MAFSFTYFSVNQTVRISTSALASGDGTIRQRPRGAFLSAEPALPRSSPGLSPARSRSATSPGPAAHAVSSRRAINNYLSDLASTRFSRAHSRVNGELEFKGPEKQRVNRERETRREKGRGPLTGAERREESVRPYLRRARPCLAPRGCRSPPPSAAGSAVKIATGGGGGERRSPARPPRGEQRRGPAALTGELPRRAAEAVGTSAGTFLRRFSACACNRAENASSSRCRDKRSAPLRGRPARHSSGRAGSGCSFSCHRGSAVCGSGDLITALCQRPPQMARGSILVLQTTLALN
ncbi:uncharacterized protein LOC110398124 [Numida meleagris]|uniref:uncharacterized protein LOC110398124 n=1 Tax=Numida meleagris TaxID=8996 RepID=UPI000B3DCDAE|nr:uncharacterized protein LOC110398124 [Numida meleagris]